MVSQPANPTMDPEGKKSSFDELLPTTSNVKKTLGISLNPLVLDDDSSDSMASKSTPAKRKPTSEATMTPPLPKKRQLISLGSEANRGFATPRGLDETLRSEEEAEIAALHAEVSKQKTALSNVKSACALRVQTLLDEKSKLGDMIEQLEDRLQQQEDPGDELERAQLENVQAKRANTRLREELAIEEDKVKKYKVELARLRTNINEARRQVRANTALAWDINLDFRDAIAAKEVLAADLESYKTKCAGIPALESKLTATETQLSKAQDQISGLQSQLRESEESRAILQSQIAKPEHDKNTYKEKETELIAKIAKAHKNTEILQAIIDTVTTARDTAKKACEKAKQEKVKSQADCKSLMDELINEREILWQRLATMEASQLKAEKSELELLARLSVAKLELSKLSNIKPNLEEAQQQIEAVNHHLTLSPFVQDPDLVENCVKVSKSVSKILNKLTGTSSESSTEPHAPFYHAPSSSGS